jgi:Protein kinase domain
VVAWIIRFGVVIEMALPVAGPEPKVPPGDGALARQDPIDVPVLGAVEPVERSGRLVLRRGLSRVTWLATSDGEPVITRGLTEPVPSARAMTLLTQLRSPRLVPLLGTAQLDGTTWLLSEQVDGVSLKRLLTLARLTPVQAGLLGAHLLRGVSALHERGLMHGRLHAGNVLISRSGALLLSDWALSSITSQRPVEELRRADFEAAGALLVCLAGAAGPPAGGNGSQQQALLTQMEQLGTETASAGLGSAASELENAVLGALPDDVGTASVRAQLAALVAIVSRNADVGSSPVEGQRRLAADQPLRRARTAFVAPTLPRSPVPAAAWQPFGRRMRTRWIFVAATVLVLASAGLIVARKPVSSWTGRLLHKHPEAVATSPKPSTRATASTKPKPIVQVATPRPVPVLAPASAGVVTGVVLRPLATCRPRSSCPLTVTIRLANTVEVERMNWAFTIVNRCTGVRTDVPGGSMTAQPGWAYVYDTRTVTVPVARSLAIVAMTTAPVRVASRPLLIATGSRTC